MSKETFTRYLAFFGDDRFQDQSVPVGVVEVKGYYRKAKEDNWFENQYANDSGILFVRTDEGGEQLIDYYKAFTTEREAQFVYNEECLWRIDKYQSRVDELKAAIRT